MLESLLQKLAEHGAMGIICALLLVALRSKDRELTVERAARLADAKAFKDEAIEMTNQQHATAISLDSTARMMLERRNPR